jgi:septum site-determining protein MinC
MNDQLTVNQALKIKGRLFAMPMLQLLTKDESFLAVSLDNIIKQAPQLFDGSPVVLDCSVLDDASINLQGFVQILRNKHVIPVAVFGANPMLAVLAKATGLAILTGNPDTKSSDKPNDSKKTEKLIENLTIYQPVRSGQQIFAEKGDLTVVAQVSHGAELLADGSIHVYGSLRGRALAGVSGNTTARIYCMSLQAELVSIAGFYLTSEQITRRDKPCQIFLKNDKVVIEYL